MVFSSIEFIYFFIPIFLFCYFIMPNKYKNIILLISSLLFYAWGEPVYILLMIFSSLVDYCNGLMIEKSKLKGYSGKRYLIISIMVNLGVLSFFKYSDFLIDMVNRIFYLDIGLLHLPLPIGISFYTFQTMSYTIDIYRGKTKAQKNILTMATYVSLFPQLIAGPIVRYQTVEKELKDRCIKFNNISEGLRRFVIGLGKKVLLANTMGWIWQDIQSYGNSHLSVISAWLGILAFGLQIYYDFSGYSDMAIGLGKILGFNFNENFNYPYISKSISEFWRRWHISLGQWFKDYLYIPLGGNQASLIKYGRNIIIVWFLTGLWHGAEWHYVWWGLYFGLFILLEKIGAHVGITIKNSAIKHIYVLCILLFSWVFFYFDSFAEIMAYIKIMTGFSEHPIINNQFMYYVYAYFIFWVSALFISTPKIASLRKTLNKTKFGIAIEYCFYIFIFILSSIYIIENGFNPFIYFRF